MKSYPVNLFPLFVQKQVRLICKPLLSPKFGMGIFIVPSSAKWLILSRDRPGPTVNKRPTWLWPGYFLTQRAKIEKFGIFRGNFPNQIQTLDGLPNRGQKFWPRPITNSETLLNPFAVILHYLSNLRNETLIWL